MPPAWSPDKNDVSTYQKPNEDINPELGFVTPPNVSSSLQIIRQKPAERGDSHIQWLLRKFPKLSSIFHLHRQIGEGTFSAVFMASLLNDVEQKKLFAVKHLVPTTHPKRIQVELSCLKLIGGQDNVVGLDLCLRENENIVFIMPYLQHKQFSDYVHQMDVEETVLYIKNLLIALRRVHSFGIIHRDVKPSNFLYNRKNKNFLLVDFGLAQVCSTNSPLATPNISSISQKRKRETDDEKDKPKTEEPASKRPALHKRNINSLNSTVNYLQSSLVSKSTLAVATDSQSKENIKDITETKKQQIQSSPFKGFKSPLKTVSTTKTKIMKSPYKFTGLDLPATHSKFQGKMPGQRRLFMDNEEPPKPIKFQKPLQSMTITTRNPLKAMSPVETKSKQIEKNLQEECKCYNRASVCTACLLRRAQEAPRAGTPGFRPPEVLLKYPDQTTAVDIWAVGVILLCILSGTYPFFRAPDDTTALAEIITLFGYEHVKKVSKLLGRNLMCSEKKPSLDIRKVCYKLRNRGKPVLNPSSTRCESCTQLSHNCLCSGVSSNIEDDPFPDSAYELLKKLLDVDPYTRISAEEALKHPFLNLF